MSFIALAFILKANEFSTLEKLFTTFAVFFKTFSTPFDAALRTLPTPLIISPNPFATLAIALNAPAKFLIKLNRPMLIAPENIVPQGIFFIAVETISAIRYAISPTNVNTASIAPFIPLNKPSTI